MKLQNLFLALPFAVTAGATVQQGDQPAEKLYKNIKVFKGLPAKEVWPAMDYMCSSLKVGCNYCHKDGAEPDDDSTPAKITTRRMVEMQREINTKYFGGRTEVTCATCHNGSPKPSTTIPVFGMSRTTLTSSGPTLAPADVLKKYLRAFGSDLKTIMLEGVYGERKTPIKVTRGQTNRYVETLGDFQEGYDGSAWWVRNQGVTKILDPGQYYHEKLISWFFWNEESFVEFGKLSFAGRDKIDGKDVVVLRSGTLADLYFDAQSGLLVRVASYHRTVLGDIPSFTDFRDYRKVGHSMVPFLVTRSEGGASVDLVWKIATPNPTLVEGFFAPPKNK